jgi:quinol monooxygenase YgiN
MSKIAMIITSTAVSGKRDELFDLYLEHLAPRAEENPRQEVVVWCADQQNPDVFHLFEIYADGETLGANAQAPWFADYMAVAMPLLAGEPSVSMAEPRWSSGL